MDTIKFEGFTLTNTGGGCTAQEFTLPYRYQVLVTDEAEAPTGLVCEVTLHENGSYVMGAHLDFAKRTVDLIEDESTVKDALIELVLEHGGFRMFFRHAGHNVNCTIVVNWNTKKIEALY